MKTAALELEFLAGAGGRPRRVAWLALALSVAFAAWIGERHSQSQQQLESLQARQDELQQRLRPAADARLGALTAEAPKRIEQANAVIERLTLPWEDLFRAVEAADSRSMALLSLEPNARDMTLRIAGEARSIGDLLAYVDRLALQPCLKQVQLVGFDTVQRDGVAVVSFTLAARWKRS